MKKMKRIMALLLAAMLVLGMSITAFADEDTKGDVDTSEPGKFYIEAPESNDNVKIHTYNVYQIFTGVLAEDGTLSNIEAGKNFDSTKEVTSALVALNSLTEDSTDEERLAVIDSYIDLTPGVFETVDSGEKLLVPAGYYLIMDDMTILNGADGAATLYILKVANNVRFSQKSGKPSVDKQVLRHDEDQNRDVWDETADHQINEEFQFRLLATVPSYDLVGYDEYYLQFNDVLSEGITYDGKLEVNIYFKASSDTIESIKPITTLTENLDYTVTKPKTSYGGELTVAIKDISDPSGVYWLREDTDIIVEVIYSAHLNDRAKVAKSSDNSVDTDSDVNYNVVDLEYSNNPNWDGTGDRPTGQTPKDTVWVFTYEVDNKKVDGSSTVSGSDEHPVLPKAGFKLYTKEEIDEETGKTVYSDPVIMRKILAADNTDVTDSTDEAEGTGIVYYIPAKEGEGGVEEMTSQEDGTFNIRGLEDGTYYLVETTTPTGYNTCDPIVITIDSEHEERADESVSLTLEKNEDSNLDNEIYNYRGTLLPRTGGIGTKIFYVVGGILVVGCGVILVTRKLIRK